MKKAFGFIPYLIAGSFVGLIVSMTIFALPISSESPAATLVTASPLMPTVTPTATPTPTPIPLPVRISIPKIQLETNVERIGQEADGKMQTPQDPMNVGWYSPGVRPGGKGSAVIDGHYDLSTGAPAAFYNLAKLEVGDQITVTDEQGQQHVFQIKNVVQYNLDEVPMDEIFADSDKSLLNLITCGGWWNVATHNYSHRTVIYSELVNN